MSATPVGGGFPVDDQPGGRAARTLAVSPPAGDAAVWAALTGAVALLLPATVLIAPPLGRLLFPPAHFHFFPFFASLVHPQPVQQAAYLLAVALTIGGAVCFAQLPAPRGRDGRIVEFVALTAKFGAACMAVWCFRRYELADQRAGAGHFSSVDLVAGVVLAVLLAGLAWWRPGLIDGPASRGRRAGRWGWAASAAATGCWLLPAIFRNRNIAHSLFAMWWHMQFVFGDFVATLNGRTPLVDYNAEYGSLVPLVLEAPFRWLGVSVGSFTFLMCALTLGALLAVERSLALLGRSERLAFVLYLPFLAAGFLADVRVGAERFYFGNYYGVFPLRYLGPYVLLWLCVRHLGGRRPRHAGWVFLAAGLALLNDIEFGLPALAAATLALAAAAPRSAPARAWLMPLLRALLQGVAGALALVVAALWLRTGQLVEPAHLTRYAQLFGLAGFGGLPTPTIGLHLVIYATFAAALITAALRHHHDAADAALTGALAYAGTFGLGASAHYLDANQVIGVFSAWGLGVALLALLALRALADWRRQLAARPPLFAAAAALILFGLLATALTQTPAPWTQLHRIATAATLQPYDRTSGASPLVRLTAGPGSQPYDRTAASGFVRRTARHGEPVVVLEGLGPLIAQQAGVEDVSPYSDVWGVWSREQLTDVINALRRAHGTRFYLGPTGTDPAISTDLARAGFTKDAYDAPSLLTEWRRPGT